MHPLLFLVGVGVRIALPEPGLRAALVQHAGSLGRQYVGGGGDGVTQDVHQWPEAPILSDFNLGPVWPCLFALLC